MLTDPEVDALARDILLEIVSHITGWQHSPFHELRETDDGEIVPVYGSTSSEGYGSFLCEYMPLEAVKKIVLESERLFDEFTVKLTDRQSQQSKSVKISDGHLPESRQASIKMMAKCATLHIVGSFSSRLREVLEETVEDGKIIAGTLLGAVVAKRITGLMVGDMTADARDDIDKAVERVATRKREMLIGSIKGLPHVMAVSQGRGGSDPRVLVSDDQCVMFATDYPGLLQHWKDVASLRRQGLAWRTYAKVVQDTPEDLLDQLANDLPDEAENGGADYPNIPSVLAHEHTARRCGIPPNTYKLSTHKNLRTRGEKIKSQTKDLDSVGPADTL